MKRFFTAILLWMTVCSPSWAGIPDKPVPSRFVCDYAGVLDPARAARLEQYLQMVSDSTTNQVVVVTIADLEDYDPADYAQRLGQKWGIGTKEKSNGVVILIKPRNDYGGGKVEIATGYGAEGALTDVMCGHIIDTEMLPYLREGLYTEAAEAGAVACVKRMNAEYTGEWDDEEEDMPLWLALLILTLILVLVMLALKDSGNKHNRHGGGFIPPIFPTGGSGGGSMHMPGHSSFGGGSFGGGGAGRGF